MVRNLLALVLMLSIMAIDLRVDASEDPYIEIAPAALAELRGRPGIATDGKNFFVVWRDTSTGSSEFFGARITPDGVNLDLGGIAIGASSSTDYGISPGVAFDGKNYLVVWADTDGEIYAVRVSSEGAKIDDSPLKVTTGANSKVRPVSIAFGGTSYLIAWRDFSDAVKVARVSTSGAIIDDGAGTTVGQGFYPWAVFDGTNYLVVWHAWGINGLDIFGNRISPTNGTPLDGTGFVICGASEDQDHASVAFDGTNYLVVWHDFRGGDIGYNDGSVYGARVSKNGVALDDPAIQISPLCRGQWPVTIAFDGINFLVVWQVDNGHLEPATYVDVFGQRVSKAGGLIGEPIPVCNAQNNQWGPNVAFNGVDKLLITWTDESPNERAGVWGLITDRSTASPEVLTGSATNITRDSATLNGTVNPNGLTTDYYFEWGPTTAYGNVTSSQSAGSGSSDVAVSANLSALTINTQYHFRIVAANSLGTTYGTDMCFIPCFKTMPGLILLLGD